MKRYTETNKWNDAWYLSLSPHAKVTLSYIYDNCDEAGFIDVLYDRWVNDIKLPHREALNQALIELQPVLLSNKQERKLYLTIFLRQEMKLPLKADTDHYIIEKLTRYLPKFAEADAMRKMLATVIQPVGKKKSKTKDAQSKSNTFVAPTLDEFKAYFKENNEDEKRAEQAWKGYNEGKWHDSEGKPIKNWKQKCQHVWFNNKNNATSKNIGGAKPKFTANTSF